MNQIPYVRIDVGDYDQRFLQCITLLKELLGSADGIAGKEVNDWRRAKRRKRGKCTGVGLNPRCRSKPRT